MSFVVMTVVPGLRSRWFGFALSMAIYSGVLRAEEAKETPAPNPTPAEASAPTPAPVSSQALQNALLVVTAREGAGSGFVGRLGNKTFLYTNAHVIAGASQLKLNLLSGEVAKPGKGSLAIGHDVAAFEAPESLLALEICLDVNKEVAIGDEVVIYGNSLGGSVVTEIKGKVVGIGPDVIEVDAPFVPGNSGSPIIHLKTGKIIGIASYVMKRQHDEISKDSGVGQVRRFGYRLDTIKQWQDLNWPIFQREAALVHDIGQFTDDYFEFWVDLNKKKGRVAVLSSANPRIQRHLRTLQRDAQSSKGEGEFEKNVTSFLWALQSEAKQEFLPGRPVPRYWFTNREWTRQKEMREEIGKDLGNSISERQTRN